MRDYPRVFHDPYAMPTFTQLFWSPSAVATLAAGYVGSAVVGFVLVVSANRLVKQDPKLTGSSARVGHFPLRLCVLLTHSPHCRFQSLCFSTTFRPTCSDITSGSLDVGHYLRQFS